MMTSFDTVCFWMLAFFVPSYIRIIDTLKDEKNEKSTLFSTKLQIEIEDYDGTSAKK